MSKVTVILGPSPVKFQEVEKVINDRPAMHVGSMSAFGLQNDPFYLSKLLIKAATIGKQIVVIEDVSEDLKSMLLVLVITGFPVEVIICANEIHPTVVEPFKPYITIIDLWKRS